MFFISNRTKASFYNNSMMTFLVHKSHVDIIFKIKRGTYLTVSVYSLSEGRLMLSCPWGDFWNRVKDMNNRMKVLAKLKNKCPLSIDIFTNTEKPHFAYLDKEKKEGAVILVIKAPIQSESISDFLHEEVIKKAMELMMYNLNLHVELENNCPYVNWKNDLKRWKTI